MIVEMLVRAATHTNLTEMLRPDDELSVALVDSETMTQLNQTYLNHDGSTDVLTFDYRHTADVIPLAADDDHAVASEIFVCTDYAHAVASDYGNTASAELVLYITHGMLHLAGYDDHEATDRKQMRLGEEQVINALRTEFDLDQLFDFV